MRLLLPLVSDFGLFTVNKKGILLGHSSEIEPSVRFFQTLLIGCVNNLKEL